jgi:uncharacterized damage-inducible protein DinB
MQIPWQTALWRQFGAAIDMFDQAVAACPDALWVERLWPDDPHDPEAAGNGRFWVVTYHTLFWLDAYLAGSVEDYTPPAPFALAEGDRAAHRPEPFSKEQLRGWLAALRQRAQGTLTALTDEQADRPFAFPWRPEQPITYLELQLYSMRHVQEHAAQLSLLLGQHGTPAETLDWVSYPGERDGAA